MCCSVAHDQHQKGLPLPASLLYSKVWARNWSFSQLTASLALVPFDVSDIHFMLAHLDLLHRLSWIFSKVNISSCNLIVLIKNESWRTLVWLITISIPLGLVFSFLILHSACQLLLFGKEKNLKFSLAPYVCWLSEKLMKNIFKGLVKPW